ncbi:MAG: DEAD/DEAH box helicase [Firmicutes bacterium]|jgi:DEAD/DEAH box helicase domain-containing protein|nr:DEAD/DEAH box helicase [Bacillota bacterium]
MQQLLAKWRADARFAANVVRWEEMPAESGTYADFPPFLHRSLCEGLRRRGINRLYSHQAEALAALNAGQHVVVVTPTASGKTLCYNLPVLNAILANPETRALYLFPAKALSQDQVAELRELAGHAGLEVGAYTYDGDTEPGLRQRVRLHGSIVVTNPDMLHAAILPHHTKWIQLFQNLKYIVIDEMHQYRGVFGSHFANVLRRLKRICRFYGSNPLFILCSATIANPGELACNLLEEPVVVIDKNGAPRAKKHFLVYNPPLVNKELGIRQSTMLAARFFAGELLRHQVQTIIFTRSRIGVEVILTYLQQDAAKKLPGVDSGIRGYRGGYLPRERRAIEAGLRSGEIRAVVSTNALELGIDIGQLDACIMTGYPGSIAATWQQAGRSGRRSGESLAVLITGNDPVNQFLAENPDYLLHSPPERALINPDNLVILTNHVRCAAFELPFAKGELFGRARVDEILEFLAEEQVLYETGGRYHWMEDAYPAEEISLRSASGENVVIIDISGQQPRVIGEVDRFSAPMLVHEEAIYIHGGEQYQVEKLDFEGKKAFVRRTDVNYYTDANLSVDLKVLDTFETVEDGIIRAWGEVRLNALVSMFKKIRFHTHENIGAGPVNLPETEMHTTAFWLAFPQALLHGMKPSELQAGLYGLANLSAQIASLFVMGDPRDLRAVCQVKAPFTGMPTIYLYDNIPGGVGYSREIFRIYKDIFAAARQIVANCPCGTGCPSCIGPQQGTAENAKRHTLHLLEVILHGNTARPAGKNECYR